MGEDANDDEVERLAEKFRQHRLKYIKKAESARFGRVYPIGRDDYTREVTEASKVAVPGDPGKGTGVVCLLYKDGSVRFNQAFSPSHRMSGCCAATEHLSTSGPWLSATQRQSLSPSWEKNAYQTFLSQDNLC